MMTAVRIAFVVLALVTSASAECAWVLWTHIETESADKNNVDDWVWTGVPNALDCYASLKATIQTQAADKPQSSDDTLHVTANAVVRGSRGTVTTYTYSCLPDTVDPRGPKGK